jgi:urease accessory protein
MEPRITDLDVVTPREFANLPRIERTVGQVGGVRCELLAVRGATRLGACYQQVPLRLLPPFHCLPDPAALLYLLNPTAGLLDGDAHLIEVTARPGTRAVVTGQSANRVHPAHTSFATQQWHLRVEAGASLVVLPGPTIPYRSARFFQRVRIDLEPGANLIWADVWLPGRYARGNASEWFCFERLIQELEVRRAGELVYRERFDWRGPWENDAVRWFVGAHGAMGSLFITGAVPRGLPPPPEAVDRAILALAADDTGLRWCGPPPAVTADVVATALRLAGAWDGTAPWLLGSFSLGPTHWFAPGFPSP